MTSEKSKNHRLIQYFDIPTTALEYFGKTTDVTQSRIRRMIDSGEIPAEIIEGEYCVSSLAIDRMVTPAMRSMREAATKAAELLETEDAAKEVLMPVDIALAMFMANPYGTIPDFFDSIFEARVDIRCAHKELPFDSTSQAIDTLGTAYLYGQCIHCDGQVKMFLCFIYQYDMKHLSAYCREMNYDLSIRSSHSAYMFPAYMDRNTELDCYSRGVREI